MHSHYRSALPLAAFLEVAAILPAAAQTTTKLASGPSWQTTDVSGASLGSAQYVVLNNQYPTIQPPSATDYGAPANPGWTADISSIPGAYWIWAPGITGATPNASLAQYSFSQQFFLSSAPQAGTFSIAVDDFASVMVNGTQVGSVGSITNVGTAFAAQSTLTTFNIAPYLMTGQNTIVVNAENGPDYFAGEADPPYSVNTAGVVFGGVITSAAVPEASTNVSLGLLLMLLGATAVAAKKAARQAR